MYIWSMRTFVCLTIIMNWIEEMVISSECKYTVRSRSCLTMLGQEYLLPYLTLLDETYSLMIFLCDFFRTKFGRSTTCNMRKIYSISKDILSI